MIVKERTRLTAMKLPIMNSIAVDTNVLLYFLDTSLPDKRKTAADIILKSPSFNSQSLSELINVLQRRWKYSKEKVLVTVANLLEVCEYISLTEAMVKKSFALVKKYDFQFFDALIVASALEANCNILYSEDMHHGLLVEGQLRILNPFLDEERSEA